MRQGDSVSATAELPSPRTEQTRFRPDIEGLRAVAVLAVVLFHAEVPGLGGGFVGVDVFFVISGFLITGLLWREASTTGTVRLRHFYGARARRLLPASALVGVFIMIGAVTLLPPLRSRIFIGDGIASALYVSNYRFALQGVDYLGVHTPPSPFQHYWSLGVEEQFYLVWPALIIGTAWLMRRGRRHNSAAASSSQRPYFTVLALIAIVSFALSLIVTHLAPPVAFFSLPTRAWQLALGGLVALTSGRWHRLPPRVATVTGWTGIGLILLACTTLGHRTVYPGTAALLPTLGAVLVIGAGCAMPSQGCGRLLGLGPMRALGRLSYSWYLWHWPVLLACWSLAPVLGHALWLALGGVLLSAVLAFLTLRFVEDPLRFAAPLRRSANRSLAVGAAATAIAVGAGLVLHVPEPVGHGPAVPALAITASPPPVGSTTEAYDASVQRVFGQVQAAVSASLDLNAVPSNLQPPLVDAAPQKQSECFLGFFEVGQPECATGDTASSNKVVLVGDSNAMMWRPAFDRVAAERHWRLETMTKAGCPLLDLPITNPVLGREYTECRQWRDQIDNRLRAEHPRLIVIGMMRRYGADYGWPTGFTSYDTAWNDSLTRQVQRLRDLGAQVLVLGPIPGARFAAPDCLSLHLDDPAACLTPRLTAVNKAGIAAESAATKAAGGRYADLTDLFCTADQCPAIVGNTLVYADVSHVTDAYSLLMAPVMGALADRALAGS